MLSGVLYTPDAHPQPKQQNGNAAGVCTNGQLLERRPYTWLHVEARVQLCVRGLAGYDAKKTHVARRQVAHCIVVAVASDNVG